MPAMFDTPKFANKLKAAGISEKHAEAEAEALAEVFELNLKELATKADVALLRTDLERLEERIEGKFTVAHHRRYLPLA